MQPQGAPAVNTTAGTEPLLSSVGVAMEDAPPCETNRITSLLAVSQSAAEFVLTYKQKREFNTNVCYSGLKSFQHLNTLKSGEDVTQVSRWVAAP